MRCSGPDMLLPGPRTTASSPGSLGAAAWYGYGHGGAMGWLVSPPGHQLGKASGSTSLVSEA
jgi:hypothetical protein